MIKREKDGENLHVGHRDRMRRKFSAYGRSVFETYELLEMLLFATIKYKDTNPIAKRLVLRFGTLNNIFSATREELCEIDGVGLKVAEFLIGIGKLRSLMNLKYESSSALFCDSYDSSGRVVLNYFRGLSEYRVSMVMLDNTLRVIGIEDICNTDYESAAVRPKNFINAAIRARAAAVVLAHTHPYGPLVPSVGDLETNRLLVNALSEAGIFCVEHYIVSGERFVGIMNKPGDAFFRHPGLRDFLKRNFGVASSFTLKNESEKAEPVYDNGGLLSALSGILSCFFGSDEADEVAGRILDRYGSLPDVLSANENELLDIPGVKRDVASFIKVLAAVLSRSETELFKKGAVYTERELKDYFKALFLGISVECIYMVTFNGSGAAIGVHLLSEGTLNSAGVSPRKILEMANSDNASRVVISHNHPLGVAKISEDDYQTTAHIASALNLAGVELTAHYVIAGNDCEILKLKFEGDDV